MRKLTKRELAERAEREKIPNLERQVRLYKQLAIAMFGTAIIGFLL